MLAGKHIWTFGPDCEAIWVCHMGNAARRQNVENLNQEMSQRFWETLQTKFIKIQWQLALE